MERKSMKNKDSLIVVLMILIVLGCKCQSDLFNSGKHSSSENEAPNVNRLNSPSKTENNPSNTSEFGEYKQCSERANLTYNVDPKATPVTLTVNNKSPIRLDIYEIGPNGKNSKSGGVSPGDTFTYKTTFRGEWYMIADTKGNCKMLVAPPNVVNVQ